MCSLVEYKPAYRHFLYVDGDEVLNGLSGILEGEEVERVETVVKELGANAGAKFGVLGAGVEFGGKGQRQTRREVRLRATVHSRVAQFVRVLEEKKGIADLETAQDLDNVPQGTLVRFRARLSDIGSGKLVLPSPPTFFDRLLRWDPFAEAAELNATKLGQPSRVSVVDFEADRARHVALELHAQALVVDRLEEFEVTLRSSGLQNGKLETATSKC